MFLPPRLLQITIVEITDYADWTGSEAPGSYDPWVGAPYQWEVTLNVSPQNHSSTLTPTPYYYDGNDIRVGDWFSDLLSGFAVQIVAINSASSGTVVVIAEDVERYNTFTDPTQQGLGIGSYGAGFLFQLGDDGLPILTPMTSVASALTSNVAWQLDQISRFRYRNMIASYFQVLQSGHGFLVGDVIYMNTQGTYSKVPAASVSIASAVGTVSSTGVPGTDYFAYRPTGRVVNNLSPALPGGPGSLIYLGASGLTATRPTTFAKPLYIQLATPTSGIMLDRGSDSVGTAGYVTQTYVVPNLLTATTMSGLNPGDQVLVEDSGDGEWQHFIMHRTSGLRLMVTQQASNVDAETDSIPLTASSPSSTLVGTLSTGRAVTFVSVVVTQAFPATAVLTVGSGSSPASLMSGDQVDLTAPGTYATNPALQFATGSDVGIYAFLSTTGSSGAATVQITYT